MVNIEAETCQSINQQIRELCYNKLALKFTYQELGGGRANVKI